MCTSIHGLIFEKIEKNLLLSSRSKMSIGLFVIIPRSVKSELTCAFQVITTFSPIPLFLNKFIESKSWIFLRMLETLKSKATDKFFAQTLPEISSILLQTKQCKL